MDERELEQLFEKFRSGVDLTDQELRKLGRGTSEFGQSLKKVGLDLTKTMGGFAKNLAEGATDFKQLNPVIDGVVGGLGEMAKAIPYAGNAVAGGLKLVAEGAKFMIGQLQEATSAFQEISKIGGLTAQGMSGLREQFLRSGMSLQGFQRTVAANAEAMSRFRGTVGQGAEDFSKIVGGIVDSNLGDELRRIGFTADEIGEATAGYISQQSRLGQAQNKTQAQLIAGSKQYAEELDILAKLTGQSRAEIQKQQDAALSEARFRAEVDDLTAQGKEKEAKALLDFQTRFAKLAPEVSQGIRDSVSGVTSEAATKLYTSTGGASKAILDRLKDGLIDQDQATKELQASMRDNIGTQREYAKAVGDGTGVFIKYNQVSDVANATLENGVLVAKRVQQQQQEGTDDLTNKTVDAQKSLEQMGRNLNNMAFQALPHAATAVNSFASVLNQATTEISKKLGIKPPTGGAAPAAAPAGGGGGAAAGAAIKKPAVAPATGTMSQRDLAGQGLVIKAGDVQAEGSTINPRLIELAKRIQSEIPGFQYFSGFNDRFHQEKSPSSTHTKGLAADFTVSPAPNTEQGQAIASQLKAMGFATVIDEYNNPSAKATAGHFHASISARDGFQGLISGPKSGYRPNIEMHGEEMVKIQPTSGNGSMAADRMSDSMGEQLGVMGAQLAMLENIVAAMRDQNSISNKILQAANN